MTTQPTAAPQPGKQLTASQEQRVTLRNLFEKQRPELAKLLPRGMDPDRLFRMALTECIKNPYLLKCTAESWALAIQTCAQQGLYPDSGLGYMYLVPRKNNKKGGIYEVSAMRGYQGDIRLARNTGEIADIYAEVVHAKDLYKVTKGLNRNIIHEPYDGDDDPGPLKACYAVAKLTSGETPFVDLKRRDVERHRASSESWEQSWSPWQKHTEAMWKKTAIHELAKWLPRSSEKVEQAIQTITGTSTAIDVRPMEAATVPSEPKTGLEGLTARLEDEQAGGPDPEPGQAQCSHECITPDKLEALGPGKVLVCVDCGEEFARSVERQPGEDDDDGHGAGPEGATEPEPRKAVEALAGAAQAQPTTLFPRSQRRLKE